MVSILPAGRSTFDVLGSELGKSLQDVVAPSFQQGFNRGNLQNSLEEIRKLSKDPNATPLDIQLAAMKAGAGIPGSERYLAQLIPLLTKSAEANKSQNISLPGEMPGQYQNNQPALPGFLNKEPQDNQNFPTNVGPQDETGNIPQAATTGKKIPLSTPQQKIADARRIAKERSDAGIPTRAQDVMPEVLAAEEDKRAHNQAVDEELAQRVKGQTDYGNRAVDYLKNVYPKATPEQQTIFQKKGEEAAARGESEAEINRYLAVEANKFANAITNVEKDLSAPRIQNKIQRAFLGTSKDFEQSANDMRVKLKPILDLGLYDTARKLLTDQGYYPEERETIINPLSEREKTLLNKVPKIPTPKTAALPVVGRVDIEKPSINKNDIKSGILDLKEANPNFSLVLARKAFEDKGYDWRSFKDALNELEQSGFKLSDDQQIQRINLDTPPLNTLQKFLEGIGITGR